MPRYIRNVRTMKCDLIENAEEFKAANPDGKFVEFDNPPLEASEEAPAPAPPPASPPEPEPESPEEKSHPSNADKLMGKPGRDR